MTSELFNEHMGAGLLAAGTSATLEARMQLSALRLPSCQLRPDGELRLKAFANYQKGYVGLGFWHGPAEWSPALELSTTTKKNFFNPCKRARGL